MMKNSVLSKFTIQEQKKALSVLPYFAKLNLFKRHKAGSFITARNIKIAICKPKISNIT
jgi:hypothetical protein